MVRHMSKMRSLDRDKNRFEGSVCTGRGHRRQGNVESDNSALLTYRIKNFVRKQHGIQVDPAVLRGKFREDWYKFEHNIMIS